MRDEKDKPSYRYRFPERNPLTDEERTMDRPLTGPTFYGTGDQRRAIPQWERAGWTLLYWTEVPNMMAVLQGSLGEIIFIDRGGLAWQGPTFSKSRAVPLEKYPPVNEWTVT
jgi:hypothetical protein